MKLTRTQGRRVEWQLRLLSFRGLDSEDARPGSQRADSSGEKRIQSIGQLAGQIIIISTT